MVFSSLPFLYYFLPVVLILYYSAPKVLKNTVLLLSSLFFYAWGEPRYVIVMAFTITVNFFLGILIEKFRKKILSKLFLAASVIFCIGILGYFKYADFFIENFSMLTGISVNTLNITLPIGISFYTFQILSYCIDVYRGSAPAQKNFINLGTYITMFPQLVAGPIVRYSDVESQLNTRTHTAEKAALGIRRLVIGLSKKIILANTLGELCASFNASNDKSILFYWLFAIAYMLQVYFDFSGYSDMAIGLGKIFGFEFCENFRYPFISKSISEFWRRWHISLGSWFRDYVYIPMGGNRVNKRKFFFNIFVVWFLTGIWHGAQWNFIVWGLYFALFLILEKFFLNKNVLKKSGLINHIYVLLSVAVSFVIFSASDMRSALELLGGMFGRGKLPFVSSEVIFMLKNYAGTFLIAIICSTPVFSIIKEKIVCIRYGKTILDVLEVPAMICLLLVSTAFLADGSFNPFLYFRF